MSCLNVAVYVVVVVIVFDVYALVGALVLVGGGSLPLLCSCGGYCYCGV